jgi:TatD DNase family protein
MVDLQTKKETENMRSLTRRFCSKVWKRNLMEGFCTESMPRCSPAPYGHNLIDIGLNLLDEMFFGVYNEKQKHPEDIQDILKRSSSLGVIKSIITCGSLDDTKKCITFLENMTNESQNSLSMTVGIHPTRCNPFQNNDVNKIMDEINEMINLAKEKNFIVAIGECGLDYDRLQFCDKETQRIGFLAQLSLAETHSLPLFLHDRNTAGDFLAIMTEYLPRLPAGGVVHSFTGTLNEMESYVTLGLYIGVNGCSLKTQENLDVVRQIPLDRLLLETDAPWCGIKNSHVSKAYVTTEFPSKKREKYEKGWMIKDRMEPCMIVQVLEVVARIKGMEPTELSRIVYDNTMKLFYRCQVREETTS